MANEMIYDYETIRPQLTTMSCLMCEHNRRPFKWIGHTAGVVVRDGQVQVFESTSLNKWSGKCGVQLHPMSTWLKNYNGKVWVKIYQPKMTYGESIRSDVFIKSMLGRAYPADKIMLLMAWLDFQWNDRDLLRYKGKDLGVFCTMLFMAWEKFVTTDCSFDVALQYAEEYIPSVMDDLDSRWGKKIRIK